MDRKPRNCSSQPSPPGSTSPFTPLSADISNYYTEPRITTRPPPRTCDTQHSTRIVKCVFAFPLRIFDHLVAVVDSVLERLDVKLRHRRTTRDGHGCRDIYLPRAAGRRGRTGRASQHGRGRKRRQDEEDDDAAAGLIDAPGVLARTPVVRLNCDPDDVRFALRDDVSLQQTFF